MILDNFNLQLYINGEIVDMDSEDTSIRINDTLFDPTKLTASTTTYSYTFDLPKTKRNCKIFDNVNVLSKRGKFSKRWDAELYSGEELIFSGSLKITEIDTTKIKCNLYIPKVNTIENLFGDSTMNMFDWFVDFDGISTINAVNNDTTTKYFFPYVAYSLPIKKPLQVFGSGYKKYTDKKTIDEYTTFYYNSFVPSLNLSELMKQLFKKKGYTLNGDIITDEFISKIYLSNHLGEEQDPLYNIGNPNVGNVDLSLTTYNAVVYGSITQPISYHSTQFTTDKILTNRSSLSTFNYIYENWGTWAYIDLMNEKIGVNSIGSEYYNCIEQRKFATDKAVNIFYNGEGAKLNTDGAITIPTDGWYEITMDATFGIAKDCADGTTGRTNFKMAYLYDGNNWNLTNVTDLDYFPMEVQLLKYDPNLENEESINHTPLLFGDIQTGLQSLSEEELAGRSGGFKVVTRYLCTTSTTYSSSNNVALMDVADNPNYVCGMSVCPEGMYNGYIKNGGSSVEGVFDKNEILYNCQGYYEWSPATRTGTTGGGNFGGGRSAEEPSTRAGTQNHGSFSGGTGDRATQTVVLGDMYRNSLPNSSTYAQMKKLNDRSYSGKTKCIIKLTKNTLLKPYFNQLCLPRSVENNVPDAYQTYASTIKLDINIRPLAPSTKPANELWYGMDSTFPKQLNLANFCSDKEKMSEFVSNIQKAFNLSYQQVGNVVTMNKNKIEPIQNDPLDISDRVNEGDAVISSIDFPKDIEVKFSIDTKEEGFYRSVDDNHINDNDWEDYGEKGSEKVILSQTDDASGLEQTVRFSYDWYNTFQISLPRQWNTHMYGSYGMATRGVDIPIIGDTEWWIEDYQYEEMSTNDGRSKNQRFFFRGYPLRYTDREAYGEKVIVPCNTSLANEVKVSTYTGLTLDWRPRQIEWVEFTVPKEVEIINGEPYYLNYKNSDNTLLTSFFNRNIDVSGEEVMVETYISPKEYKDLTRGKCVKFNDDIYRVMKIQGFDPSGNNKTKLYLTQI